MKIIIKIILTISTVIILTLVYLTTLMDNVYVRVENHSRPIKLKTWTENQNTNKLSDYLINDSIPTARYFGDELRFSGKTRTESGHVIKVKVNDEKEVYEEKMILDKFQFVSILINTSGTSEPRIVINIYSLKEAWDMGLIFGQEG